MSAAQVALPDAGQRRVALRVEVQVLRAVAVMGVVANHLWPHNVRGGYIGVDVFLVISGYLISGQLLHELRSTRRIEVARFWARRARRLLPASMLVLGASIAGTLLLVPESMWKDVMRQIASSALYFQNWTLAHDAQDYFRSGESPSPVTHYWSLSLEEQFYLVWPVLAWLAFTIGRAVRRPRTTVFVVFTMVAAASYVWSVHFTRIDPHAAYFETQTRVWELAVGGMLAHFAVRRRLRLPIAALGWLAILASMYFLTEETPFPGSAAIIPVLGTAVVIWCGDGFQELVPPFVRMARGVTMLLGRISYPLYLWHWPLIVLTPYAIGHGLTNLEKVEVLGTSVVLAWLSTVLLEDRVRASAWLTRGSALRSLLPAALAMAAVVATTVIVTQHVDRQVVAVSSQVDKAADQPHENPCFGARAIQNSCADPHRLTTRNSELLTSQSYTSHLHGGAECMQDQDVAAVLSCQFGTPAAQATARIALVGDSHARHWAPALDALALEHHWNVVLIAKGSCPLNIAAVTTERYVEDAASCHRWVSSVLDQLTQDPTIDAVVTSSSSRRYLVEGRSGSAGTTALRNGFRGAWSRLTQAGKAVLVVGDVPAMDLGDIPSCVARAKTREDPCWVARSAALTPDPMLQAVAQSTSPLLRSVNLSRFFCDASRCHAVIGGVVAWADENHIIGYFARTLAPFLDAPLEAAMVARHE
ncbi:acyltransferase family protein [Nocardioides montaniterrae]